MPAMDRAANLAWRKGQRAALIDARAALPLDVHAAAGTAIFDCVQARLGDRLGGRTVGFYWPFRREFDPLPLAGRHIAGGGGACLPVVGAKNQPLTFRAWTPGATMARGVWDIAYPAQGETVQPQVLIVPLVGFDMAGFRLGYGGGYYDRTLEAADGRPMTIGVGAESCRLPTIHPLPHDVALDYVVTERTLYARGPQGLCVVA